MSDTETPDIETPDGEVPMHVLAEQSRAAKTKRTRLRVVRHNEPPPPTEPGAVPVIRLTAALHDNVDAACEALAAGDLTIYQRAGELARVVRVAATEADTSRREGTPEIRAVAIPTLRERLARVAQFEKWVARESVWSPTLPTDPVVSAVAARAQWPGIRPLAGIAEAPFLAPSGVVVQTPGYDSGSRVLYVPGAAFPKIPDAPTQADACFALAELAEIFQDFPFGTEAGRYVPIAALLTLLARPAIRGAVPAFVFDATTAGSGKGLQANVVGLLATGREAPVMNWPTDDEELEKVLGSYALRGAAIVCLDEVTTPFGGGPLNRYLTAADMVDARVLGRSEVPSLPWRGVILATGNNVVVRGDTERRVLVSRLEPPDEHPEERTGFQHPDLLGWVRVERPRLVAAALTVLRGYVAAGRPDAALRPWGSFEAWAALIPQAIRWAGGADVMEARLSATGTSDPEREALQTILANWGRLDTVGKGLTLRSALELLYPPGERPGERPPDGFDELRDALEELAPLRGRPGIDTVALGFAFRKMRGRWCGGRRLDAAKGRTGAQAWSVRGDTNAS